MAGRAAARGSPRALARGGGPAVADHRPRRRRAARRRAAPEGDREHGGGDRQHRRRGGAARGIPVGNTPGRADRRHRRPRVRAAARAGAADRAGRGEGARGRVADVGAGRRPRRRPGRRDARDRRLGPDRAGGRAPRRGVRDGDRPQLALVGRAARRAARARRLRLPAHAAHARDAASDRRRRAGAHEADRAAGQHRARRRGRPGRAARRRCTPARSPARRSTSPTPSRCPPTTRCSTRRTCSWCRTSAPPPCARVRGWRRWRWRTCWPRSTAARCRTRSRDARRRRRHRHQLHAPARRRGRRRRAARARSASRSSPGSARASRPPAGSARSRCSACSTRSSGYAEAIERHGARRPHGGDDLGGPRRANGAEFAAAVRERYGLEAVTLSGDEEARLTYLGATAARGGDEPLVVIDIGGGSTELVVGARRRGRLPRLHPGRRRAPQRAPPALRPADAGELQALADDARAVIDAAVPADVRGRPSGGDRRRRHRDPVRVDRPRSSSSTTATGSRATRYSRERLEGCATGWPRCRSPSAARSGPRPGRAPTIVAGVVILIEASARSARRRRGVRARHPLGSARSTAPSDVTVGPGRLLKPPAAGAGGFKWPVGRAGVRALGPICVARRREAPMRCRIGGVVRRREARPP